SQSTSANFLSYETEDVHQKETTTGNEEDWCPVGTSWKTSNPTTGEEVSMVYTGTREVDGIQMCVMEYTSTNPDDEVAKVEYMFSEDSETFSWKSYYANGTVQSEMTMKDGKMTMIDENGQVTEFNQ
ncbi:MAG TPA: membrane-binding protein, partial [Methanomethylovorans sp.]|nr:membrane-binding protein [Methanomethylovorans sp.]